MAREKKVIVKEMSVEEKLKALYKLQTIYSTIDEIKLLRGELPLEVQDLEDEIAGMGTRIENFKQELKDIDSLAAQKKIEIGNAKEQIEKYKSQQENVRNSREFDHLSKEIEFQLLEVELCEKKIREAIESRDAKSQEIKNLEEIIADKSADLEQKCTELDTIVAETKQKEENLRTEAKTVEEIIEPRLLTAFKRIRKNARNGLAVVTVQRGACGGCFNNIPPQRQLDIRSNKKIIVCEYCGRILVDQELADVVVKATSKKVRKKKSEKTTDDTSDDDVTDMEVIDTQE